MNLALKFEDMRYVGYEEGVEKGIEQGAHAAKLEVAKASLLEGLDISTIVKLTGLTEEEIKSNL